MNTMRQWVIELLQLSLVSPSLHRRINDISAMQLDQKRFESQSEDEELREFRDWLSPSYWLVEAQLAALKKQRATNTLQWVRKVNLIREWHERDNKTDTDVQTLWIKGPP